MTPKELETIRAWFLNYADTFISEIGQFIEFIRPKLEHSLLVADNCHALAKDMKWPENEVTTAEAIGILHDAGRFSQFAEYGTFVDYDSVNHGERGYEVVCQSEILAFLSRRYRNIILDGIRYHNCNEFSFKVQPESLSFLRLVRDADKLDKLRITHELIKEASSKKNLTVQSDGPINRKVLNQIHKNRPVSKKNIMSTLDFYLFRLSSIFDINYPATYKRLLDSGTLEMIIPYLPDEKDIHTASKSMLTYLKTQAAKV